MLSVAFAPYSANAGFFADLLSTRAEAGGESLSGIRPTGNSQTLALLEANAVLSLLLETKTTKKEESKDEAAPVDENSTVNILSDNALMPAITAAAPDEDANYSDEGYDIEFYVVKSGDSVASIAKLFGITADTIYSANELTKGAKVKTGDVLIIPAYSGVNYKVKKGDTLQGIAKKFSVPTADIIGYNGITGSKITINQELFIPGGALQEEAKKPTPKPSSSSSSGRLPVYDITPATNADGYYIKPIPCRITQGRHDSYAVDMGCRVVGTPIHAAASGEVIFTGNGYNGGYGRLVIISHPNGTKTYYAHQSKIAVSKGQYVEQGQVIGYVGNTGRSTGPHLHFEVRGAKNPGFDNSWKPFGGY